MKKISAVFAGILLSASLFCFGQKEEPKYTIANKFHIEGDGSWDYLALDENTGRLFVSHSTVTNVISIENGKPVKTIENTKGVHGIAIDPEDDKVFISCGRDSSVTVVKLSTLDFLLKVKVTGANPDAILYDKFSGKVFVYNGRSSNATVIDAKTNGVVATIPLAGKPEFSVTDGKGKVYVNIEDKSLVTAIDSTSLKVDKSWPIAPGEEPSGLAIDVERNLLFSVCDNKKMVVSDASKGVVAGFAAIGSNVDGCAYDPALKRAYSSNGEGTMTVIQIGDKGKFTVLGSVPTQKGARTICLNHKTHHLYLPAAEFGDPPAATSENPHPRPAMKPGTFVVLDVAPN